MAQFDLKLKEVVSLSVDMDKKRYKSFLEKFEKDDFISYFLEEQEQDNLESTSEDSEEDKGDSEDEF